MEKKCLNNRNSGFSMVEMLAVVAIIVILLGISMVSVARYRDLLKITELDNAAREIYMAAENRAVLLSGSKRLSNRLDNGKNGVGRPVTLTTAVHADADAKDEELYYVSKASMTEDLLTNGSIDPELMDGKGDFYIVYDKNSGSVTDVFYAEESMSKLIDPDFETFYEKWAVSRSERLKLKDKMLVGWYSGEAAQGSDEKKDFPEEPWIRVIIENGEELTVTVKYENVPANGTVSIRLGNLDLTKSIPLPANRLIGTLPAGVASKDGELSGVNGTGSVTWVLDSLTKGQFKDLKGLAGEDGGKIVYNTVTPGDDFAVEATLTPQTPGDFEAVSDRDNNNSLFLKGSGEAIAGIGYLRHLQNLDTAFSSVTGKTSAVQSADILCKGNETYGDYDFIPIYNANLARYNGAEKEIRNLYVSGTKLTEVLDVHGNNVAHAGLFSRTATGTSAPLGGYTFENIRLVNASVTAAEGCYAGALVGQSGKATLLNCWVYWELDETLKAELIKNAENNEYNYQINGKCAGGLAGVVGSGTEIRNSLAATLVSGTDCAGGLIGGLEDGGDVTVSRSYADCYLTGTGTGSKVAGLVGNVSETSAVTLLNCYAAGYIIGGNNAAGLCLGKGTTDATNVYSVMRYPGRGSEKKFFFLTEHYADDSFTNTHFLGKESDQVGSIKSTVYANMTNKGTGTAADNGFATTMRGQFEWKQGNGDGTINSHPYNLREHLTLDAYSFPGLKNLPHYGDWGAEFKEPSLVYYEKYSDATWGVSGGNARDLINNLSNTKTILSDGYGVAFLKADLPKNMNKPTLICTYSDCHYDEAEKKWEWSLKEEEISYDKLIPTSWKNDEGNTAEYYMIPLSDTLINSGYAQNCFYRYLKFELKLGGENENPTGEYFYNPHFAETVVPVVSKEGVEGGWIESTVTEYASDLVKVMGEVKVRTPRHLYDLSHFKEYYDQSQFKENHGQGDVYRQYVYRQMLDLDYSTYTGYDSFIQGKQGKPYLQQPIGSGKTDPEKGKNDAFEGTYDGGCYMIKGVVPDAKETAERQYAGLFGYSKGTLRNIVYQMDAENRVDVYLGDSAQDLYVGALAGGSEGTIDNCAVFGVNLRAGASGVRLYVGGLVGWNGGTIRNSAAELAQLSADCLSYASVYVGGLVGENGASRNIYTSYAVGRIGAVVDKTIETARICGFVGWNYGNISNSYAAVNLSSGGDNVEAYGFCGMRAGSQSGNVYLDQGNFTYRGSSYAADYNRTGDKAQSTVYANLTKADSKDPTKSDAVPGMGLGGEVWNTTDAYPYPAAVRDRTGAYIHYGKYPVPMPLGDMGVFYWEKLVNVETGEAGYYMSALAVDPKEGTITKQSTLSTEHNDGCIVTQYGYGYYEETENAVRFSSTGIEYLHYEGTRGVIASPFTWENRDSMKNEAEQRSRDWEEAAEVALQEQFQGDYTFHCWNTYREAPRPAVSNVADRVSSAISGLCTTSNGANGALTLTQNGANSVSVTFTLNPKFADAMSVANEGGMSCDGTLRVAPGGASNPYQVRCGMQLQEINWHNRRGGMQYYTDVAIGEYDHPIENFTYLSGPEQDNSRYCWKQTHDMDWEAERKSYSLNGKSDEGVFFPIAQVHAGSSDNDFLPGWFSGTFDGQNYTLKNFAIDYNSGYYHVNTTGLFGVVKGATLRNIVMFSETGENFVTVKGRTDVPGISTWYAGGVLVGLALKGDHDEGEITNCAVAGYTVIDQTTRTRTQDLNNKNKPNINLEFAGDRYVDMGGAIGGLVGMTNMDLTGCMASVTIELKNTYGARVDGNSGDWYVPLRVGGLVGSTTGKVTNCYTGGTIDLSNATNEIYVGMITGGVGIVTSNYYKREEVTVRNCYSYMELTGGNSATVLKYARMNGTYGGTTKRENNYYLGDPWRTGINDNEERSITYRQLAGEDAITGTQKIYALLTGYNPVTSTLGGVAVGGRYSYAPKSRAELQGLDYPFPTVLTQPGNLHVHYGGWPLRGIVRDKGGAHIRLDMFADRTKPEIKQDKTEITTWREHAETLKLSDGVGENGAWSAAVVGDGAGFVEAKFDDPKTGELTVTAKKPRLNPVTVTVTYTEPAGETYTMNLTVFVTAKVELRPNAVTIFPNDTITVPLSAYGVEPGETDYKPINGGTLTVDPGVTGLSDPITSAEVVTPPEGEPDVPPSIKLIRGDGEAEDDGQWADVTYTFKKGDYTSEKTVQRIAVNLPDLPESWNEEGTVWTLDFSEYKPTALDATSSWGYVDINPMYITLRKLDGAAEFPEDGVQLTVTLTVPDDFVDAGVTHNLTITVQAP